jgi:hypothetical protein
MPVDRYIATLRENLLVPTLSATEESCTRASRSMGLVHTLQDFELLRKDPPELCSPRALGREPSRARKFAGTEDAVCFYVGPPMLESERPGALVFHAEVEEEGGAATPWDSGGLNARRAQHLDADQRKALLRARTMPAPDYRRALAVTLLLRFGGEPARYLRSEAPDGVDPDGVYDGDPASFTYETRLPGRLAIQTPELSLVVMRRDYMDEGAHRLRSWCFKRKVPFEVIDESSQHRTVRDAVLDFGVKNIL